MKTILKNCKLITPPFSEEKLYDIFIEGGLIADIGENLHVEDAKELDLDGHVVLPGFIDMHCNICEPGFENIEDISTVSRSAARGGFTSITCEPNTKPVIDNKTVVEYIISKSKAQASVNIYPYGSMSMGCEGTAIAEIGEMYEAGVVAISDGDEFIDSAALMRNVMRYSRMFDLPIMTHCEDRSLSGKGVMNEGYTASCLGLSGMPREAEELQVARNILLAEITGARLHIAHVSTGGSVRMVRDAKKRGLQVTCETCPHYFALTEEAVEDYNTFAKVNPPLRTQEDVEAILEGIVDGTIDAIASGHSPTSRTDKDKEFGNAAYGISALETAFSISFTKLVETGIISLARLVELMSKKPAEILKLEQKGEIAVGKDADLIVIETKGTQIIEPELFASKAKFSPFAGQEVKGRVVYTIVGGKIVS